MLCMGRLLLPRASHHFPFSPLCIWRKGELVHNPEAHCGLLSEKGTCLSTGRAFVCGSASFKFSFIGAPLPTLWPIISCNIGHPRLCEAAAPFAFLIRVTVGREEKRGKVGSEVTARLLSLLMKGWGQCARGLKGSRRFPTGAKNETQVDANSTKLFITKLQKPWIKTHVQVMLFLKRQLEKVNVWIISVSIFHKYSKHCNYRFSFSYIIFRYSRLMTRFPYFSCIQLWLVRVESDSEAGSSSCEPL